MEVPQAATQTASRPDQRMAKIVDAGIGMISARGRTAAVAYLAKNGVNDKVMARVINEPNRRRSSHALEFAYSGVTFQFDRHTASTNR